MVVGQRLSSEDVQNGRRHVPRIKALEKCVVINQWPRATLTSRLRGFMRLRKSASTRVSVSRVAGAARTTTSTSPITWSSWSGVTVRSVGSLADGWSRLPITRTPKARARRATSVPIPPSRRSAMSRPIPRASRGLPAALQRLVSPLYGALELFAHRTHHELSDRQASSSRSLRHWGGPPLARARRCGQPDEARTEHVVGLPGRGRRRNERTGRPPGSGCP